MANNVERISLSLTRVVKYVFRFELDKDIWDEDIHTIKGERNAFFKYVHEFKKANKKYKNLDFIYFIVASNIHNENLIMGNYLDILLKEIQLKLKVVFNIMNKYSEITKIKEDGTIYEVKGDIYIESIDFKKDKIVFIGENSREKFMAILFKLDKLFEIDDNDEENESNFYRSVEDFVKGLYTIERLIHKKDTEIIPENIIDRHLYKMLGLRGIIEIKKFCEIETNKEDFRLNKWHYEFDVEEVEFVMQSVLGEH